MRHPYRQPLHGKAGMDLKSRISNKIKPSVASRRALLFNKTPTLVGVLCCFFRGTSHPPPLRFSFSHRSTAHFGIMLCTSRRQVGPSGKPIPTGSVLFLSPTMGIWSVVGVCFREDIKKGTFKVIKKLKGENATRFPQKFS